MSKKQAEAAPAVKKSDVVSLLEINTSTIEVTVKGTSSYIPHAWSPKAIRMMEEAQQKKAKRGREAKDPDEEYNSCFYRDSKGRYAIPANSFKQAMVSAATGIDDKVNFPKTKIRQCVFVNGDLIPIEHDTEPERRCDPVRVGQGSADLRYRPEFKDWRVKLSITFDEGILSKEQVINLLNRAGFGVGVGEWRPECDGNFGRFAVVPTK